MRPGNHLEVRQQQISHDQYRRSEGAHDKPACDRNCTTSEAPQSRRCTFPTHELSAVRAPIDTLRELCSAVWAAGHSDPHHTTVQDAAESRDGSRVSQVEIELLAHRAAVQLPGAAFLHHVMVGEGCGGGCGVSQVDKRAHWCTCIPERRGVSCSLTLAIMVSVSMVDGEGFAAAARGTPKISRIDQADAPIPDSTFSRASDLCFQVPALLPPPEWHW